MTSAVGFAILALAACSATPPGRPAPRPDAGREQMVEEQIESRGIKDPLTLAALREVPRHEFVPEASAGEAYGDFPLPIGHGQTISQPYIVAFMTEALGLRGGENVLEIGTGSGYQSAVLAKIATRVYTIEIVTALAEEAKERLAHLGYGNVAVPPCYCYLGWPE